MPAAALIAARPAGADGLLPGLRIHVCLGTLTTDYREFSPINIEIQP
jgi:hypothetical protein